MRALQGLHYGVIRCSLCLCALLLQFNFYSRSAGSVGECLPHCALSPSQTPRFNVMKANINLAVAPAVLLLKQMVSDKQEPRGHSSVCLSKIKSKYIFKINPQSIHQEIFFPLPPLFLLISRQTNSLFACILNKKVL